MEIKLLDKDTKNNKITFLLKGTNPVVANTIRRSIIEDVPTMAIEVVEFKKNSSLLYDEIIAHRLGLIPLKTDLKNYVFPSECKCKGEGCGRCQVKFNLTAKGPGMINTSELVSNDPKTVPIIMNIPIVKLLKGQELQLEATAILGKGKTHIKWSPAHTYYTYEPEVKTNKNSTKIEQFREQFPPQIFDKNGKINESELSNPHILDACDGICDEIIKISYKDDSFIFTIESWGQLKPVEIFKEALTQFNNKLEEFETKFK